MTRDYAAAVDYLLALKARGVQPGLDRIRGFVAALGHPERAVPCLHVTGTNGKGSVAAMLEAGLRAAGWRTGLYTSPHLVRLGERIQVDRRPLAPEEIAGYVGTLRPLADALSGGAEARPSYFEFMTAMAFVHFARERCDIAIIEAGMGGRVDATNVVIPEVSVIASIGLDHCEFLGGSIREIAVEKAGIVKAGRPVAVGPVPPEAERVLRAIATDRGAPISFVEEAFGRDPACYPATNLEGERQRANAATAVLAARALSARWRLKTDAMATALQTVEWPGRWQRIRVGRHCVILDGAHNADAAEALDRNLAQLAATSGRPPVVILGALGAGRARALLAAACRHARAVRLVVPNQSRACSHAELEALAPPESRRLLRRADVRELFPTAAICAAGEPDEPIVVTGSLYLIGEVLAQLDAARGPLEDQLQDF